MKRICIILFVLLMATRFVESQENITYQVPPAEILELVDIERAPSVNMDSKGEQMLFLYRNTFKTLSDLNQPEVRLAGLRINPDANISSTVTYSNNIRYKKTKEKEVRQIEGLPSEPLIAYMSFSPDETKLAFTNTVESGVELWIVDLKTLQARRVTDAVVNANAGFPYSWFNDGSGLLVRMLPENRPELIDTQKALPEGPIVSVSDGQISQNRTYQDLLKNPVDEANFETLMTSELYKVGFDGSKTRWKEAGMYISQSFSLMENICC